MTAINKLRKRKAISPVIATVILVAMAITVAVAVSYWMSSIAGQYTSFEKVEIKSAYASRKDTESGVFQGWVITIGVQNTGSSTSTLESLFVNEKPMSEYGVSEATGKERIRWTSIPAASGTDTWTAWSTPDDAISVSLESGDVATMYVLIYGDKTTQTIDPDPETPGDEYDVTEGLFSAGTTINVKFHSAGGMDYIKLVQLT